MTHPNAELVAKHWLLAAVPGLDNNVATTLPDPPWPNDEFVQVMQVGGTPDMYVPRFNPVVTVNCFAMKQNSSKPPWNKASDLAMRILLATYSKRYADSSAYDLDLPAGYGRALVQSVYPVSDVRKLPSDPSQYAVYNIDLQISWVPASLVIT